LHRYVRAGRAGLRPACACSPGAWPCLPCLNCCIPEITNIHSVKVASMGCMLFNGMLFNGLLRLRVQKPSYSMGVFEVAVHRPPLPGSGR
jgi:hypothetical protein